MKSEEISKLEAEVVALKQKIDGILGRDADYDPEADKKVPRLYHRA